MTTLRRAASRLPRLESASAWMLSALLIAAAAPAAAGHSGGGGGGHAGGGGGHASGGHASAGGGGHAGGGGGHASGGHASAGGGGGFRASGGGGYAGGGGYGGGRGYAGGGGYAAMRSDSPRVAQPSSPGRAPGGAGGSAQPNSPGRAPGGPGAGGFSQPGSPSRTPGDPRVATPGHPSLGNRQPGRFHGGFRDGRFHRGFDNDDFFGFGFWPYYGPSYWANLYWGYYPGDYGYPYPAYGFYSGYYPGYEGTYGGNYGGGYGGPDTYRDRSRHDRMGALDLDISPSDTQVFLNGQYIGVVDDFDGWPDYLWLEPGTYDIVFYHEGYKTLARQVTIYPGLKITYNDELEKGQATRPEDLPAKSHERRDERLRYDRQRERELSNQQGEGADWRDRVRGEREGRPSRGEAGSRGDYEHRVHGRPVDAMPGMPPPASPPLSDAAVGAEQRAHLHLTIEPDDASVYLDGRFAGTAGELSERGGGLVVSAGQHRLAVVRPGRKAEERSFQVVDGKDLDLEVRLEPLH